MHVFLGFSVFCFKVTKTFETFQELFEYLEIKHYVKGSNQGVGMHKEHTLGCLLLTWQTEKDQGFSNQQQILRL